MNSAGCLSGKVMRGTTAARKHAGRSGSTEAGLCPQSRQVLRFRAAAFAREAIPAVLGDGLLL